MTLEQAKAAKKQEMRAACEDNFWRVFAGGGAVPNLQALYLLCLAPYLNKPLSAAQKQQLQDAAAVAEKLPAKLAAVEAATTPAEVEAIQWTP